ncbi:MAG: hypothetical protein A2X45_13425 [Lentisphaerae bacterium GWF2_50_93]|nr:MAG: hypothetical protein A2X45_13425 [Lentisphaerae bacterium GWF2_50_93]
MRQYESRVKDGSFILPKQFRHFNDGEATVFWKTSNFHALTLFPHTADRSLNQYKPEIMKRVSVGSRGTVNLGRDICRKVFNSLDFDSIILGAGNGVQVWNKTSFLTWQETDAVEVLKVLDVISRDEN